MSTAAFTLADLRTIDLFDDLDDERLAEWVEATVPHDAAAGDLFCDQGEYMPGLLLLFEGEVRNFQLEDGRPEPLGRQAGPTWIGAIASLTEGRMPVRVMASSVCRAGLVPPERFIELALADRSVHKRIMNQVGPVMARLTATEQTRERLASLGTMAAGLAHELNNPAAAAKRAASQLVEALDVVSATLGEFVEAGIERDDAERLVALQRAALARAGDRTPLQALDAADAEDEMLDRLEALGVPEPWRLAEPLAAAGLDGDWLADVNRLAGPATGAALRWVAASLTARGLAGELLGSAERMGALVGAVKAYAYMDRGDVVVADVHEGLETTLVMLGHKLKHTGIAVVREYDRSLPALTLRGSELNQVWTNLLDNAIDALGTEGTITIRTRRDGDCALIEIADDGPGIPEEARNRVLDPFFTTKDVGKGTGLGLDSARRIVEDRHTGSLTFDTGSGGTTFHVWLPFEQTAR